MPRELHAIATVVSAPSPYVDRLAQSMRRVADCQACSEPACGMASAPADLEDEASCRASHISTLSACCLWRVFMLLPFRARAMASCTCREWRAVLASPDAWQQATLDDDGTPLSEDSLVAMCSKARGTLRSLRLGHNNGAQLRPSSLLQAIIGNAKLTEVHATQLRFPWSGLQCIAALDACPALHTLRVDAYMTGEVSDTTNALVSSLASRRLHCAKLHVAGRLRGETISALADAMAEDARLNVLQLNFADVDDSAMTILARGLTSCASLTHLCLRGNSISSVGALALASALSRSAVRELVLGSNALGDAGATAIAVLLRENTSITTLDLSGNGITPSGAVSLAAGLIRNATLRSLCLDFNAVGPVGAAAIAAALPSTELESLDLEWNGIRCAGAAVFAFTLQQRTSGTLRHLGIASNSIRAGGAIMLAGALRNSGLESLVLAHNTDLGHSLAGATVAAAVATCASLKHLDVTACGLDADAMTLLCHALEQPSCALVALRAGGNPAVGQSAVHSLARAAARNSVLRELCFTMVHNECPRLLSTDVTLTRDPLDDVGHWVGAPHARTTPWRLL